MNLNRICVLYFSPTGGTEKIARIVAGKLAAGLGLGQEFFDLTRPQDRQTIPRFGAQDLLVMASPVYAGRLPNKIAPEFKAKICGDNTPVVPICVFGNRSPDEAPRELVLLLEENGFWAVGAAAFAGRHAFSDLVGAGRPDEEDLAEMAAFADGVVKKLARGAAGENKQIAPVHMDRSEIGPYYTPLKTDGTPAKFLKAKPQTDEHACMHCGLCARVCPLGSIDAKSAEATGLCMKCQACVRRCPNHAKSFADADFLSHVAMLEENYTKRAKNILFIE